jgi:hypothetical protein
VVLIGRDAPLIKEALPRNIPMFDAASMEEAVTAGCAAGADRRRRADVAGLRQL